MRWNTLISLGFIWGNCNLNRVRPAIGRLLMVATIVSHSAPLAMAQGTLRFVTLEFAPFIYGENQEVAGPGRDVIAAVCERAGVACSFDIYPWRRAQELIRAGEADGMMVIGRNPAREEWLHFSPPTVPHRIRLLRSVGQSDGLPGPRPGRRVPGWSLRALEH